MNNFRPLCTLLFVAVAFQPTFCLEESYAKVENIPENQKIHHCIICIQSRMVSVFPLALYVHFVCFPSE